MAGSKQVIGVLLAGILLWAGLGLPGPQALLGERTPGGRNGKPPREGCAPAGSVELRCQVEPPTTILSVVAPGESVKKGDPLVELDTSAFVDKRMLQILQLRKAEAEMTRAARSRQSAEQAGQAQVDLAQRALRLAQGRLKAFTEGEYPQRLALAEGAAAIARQKLLMIQDRVMRLRVGVKDSNDHEAITLLQETEIELAEAKMQATGAEGSLAILKTFLHGNRVAELELAVAQREFDLARAKAATADANVQASMALSLAEMSPHDGVGPAGEAG